MLVKSIWHGLQGIVITVGGWLGWFMGGWDGFLYALVIFVIVDYLSGFICAVVDKKLSSEIGTKGILKKVMIFVLVGIGHTIDIYLIDEGNVIRTAVIFFFVSNEGISLLENTSRLGLPVPKKMKDILSQLHSGGDKNK